MITRRLMAATLWVLASAAIAAEPKSQAPRPDSAAEKSVPEASGPAERSTPRSAEPASAPTPARDARGAARADRLDLDTTVVTGNRELPKVLYIVPWKKADIGELPGQPFNTLLDEALTPVDRDVFRREVTYYGAISGQADGVGAAPSAPPQRTGGSEK